MVRAQNEVERRLACCSARSSANAPVQPPSRNAPVEIAKVVDFLRQAQELQEWKVESPRTTSDTADADKADADKAQPRYSGPRGSHVRSTGHA